MKIDFSKVLVTLDGSNLMENGQGITIGSVCYTALLTMMPDDKTSGEEKIKRFMLATAIYAAKESLDLPIEDIVKIKKLVGELCTPIVVAQVWPVLDGKTE